jgi:hypothetical protein
MYISKTMREAPAKWVDPYTRTEVLGMDVDKKADVVATYRRNGRVNRSTVRLDDNGERYFPACRERVYLVDLKAATA